MRFENKPASHDYPLATHFYPLPLERYGFRLESQEKILQIRLVLGICGEFGDGGHENRAMGLPTAPNLRGWGWL